MIFFFFNYHKIQVYCIQNDRTDHTNSTNKKKIENWSKVKEGFNKSNLIFDQPLDDPHQS